MFRNEALIVWILSYEAHCSAVCIDIDGIILDCQYGCCGDKPDRHCCTFQVWIIIVFSIAGAAVLIPVAVILFCCIRDKTCPRKPSAQSNPRRRTVQLRATTQVPSTCSTTCMTSLNNGGTASLNNGGMELNNGGTASVNTDGTASVNTAGPSSMYTAGSSSMYTAGSSSMYTAGSSLMYGSENPAYTHPETSTARP